MRKFFFAWYVCLTLKKQSEKHRITLLTFAHKIFETTLGMLLTFLTLFQFCQNMKQNSIHQKVAASTQSNTFNQKQENTFFTLKDTKISPVVMVMVRY